MPYKDKSKKRKWESTQTQKQKNAERQSRHRQRREKIESLAAIQQIIDRTGNPTPACAGPKLLADLAAHKTEVREFLDARNAEPVEVWKDGVRLK